MLLYAVHTIYECSGAVEHGHNGGLCTVFTCSWRVANFGSPTLSGHSSNWCPRRGGGRQVARRESQPKTPRAQVCASSHPGLEECAFLPCPILPTCSQCVAMWLLRCRYICFRSRHSIFRHIHTHFMGCLLTFPPKRLERVER